MTLPRLDVWMSHPRALRSILEQVRSMRGASSDPYRVRASAAEPAAAAGEPKADGGSVTVVRRVMVGEGIALVEVLGPIVKDDFAAWWYGGTNPLRIRQQIAALRADEGVKGILLRIDSPGGYTAGVGDLADEVYATSKAKPVHAFIEDMGASAAYWIASQARRISTNPTGTVGSIGTYAVVEDLSKMASDVGIKVHVVTSSHPHKGAFVEGTEILPEQLSDLQREIDVLNGHFLAGVMRGRRLSEKRMAALATGQCWIGAEAVERRLVDAVGTLEDAISVLAGAVKESGAPRKGRATAERLGMELDELE